MRLRFLVWRWRPAHPVYKKQAFRGAAFFLRDEACAEFSNAAAPADTSKFAGRCGGLA
jgi:hypothetical protein